jgi:hypothetical protein
LGVQTNTFLIQKKYFIENKDLFQKNTKITIQKNITSEIKLDNFEEELTGGRTYDDGGRGMAPNGSLSGSATGSGKLCGTKILHSNDDAHLFSYN